MPVYAYKGVDQAGKATKGSVTAESARAARAKMRSGGVFLTEIDEEAQSGSSSEGGATRSGSGFNFEINLPVRIPPLEKAMATRQLATLVSAGVPLVESLGALVEQSEHKALKGVFVQIRDRVNEGDTLCIIEAMKLLNEIEADSEGTIKTVLVDNGQPVEYGQPLFVIA